jgi:hypothetical protein
MPEFGIRILTKSRNRFDRENYRKTFCGYGRGIDQVLPYLARCLFEFAESRGLVAAAL